MISEGIRIPNLRQAKNIQIAEITKERKLRFLDNRVTKGREVASGNDTGVHN